MIASAPTALAGIDTAAAQGGWGTEQETTARFNRGEAQRVRIEEQRKVNAAKKLEATTRQQALESAAYQGRTEKAPLPTRTYPGSVLQLVISSRRSHGWTLTTSRRPSHRGRCWIELHPPSVLQPWQTLAQPGGCERGLM